MVMLDDDIILKILGSRLCNPNSELSDMFIEKTEAVMQMIGGNLAQDPTLVMIFKTFDLFSIGESFDFITRTTWILLLFNFSQYGINSPMFISQSCRLHNI
jgi:hypothetical protein